MKWRGFKFHLRRRSNGRHSIINAERGSRHNAGGADREGLNRLLTAPHTRRKCRLRSSLSLSRIHVASCNFNFIFCSMHDQEDGLCLILLSTQAGVVCTYTPTDWRMEREQRATRRSSSSLPVYVSGAQPSADFEQRRQRNMNGPPGNPEPRPILTSL